MRACDEAEVAGALFYCVHSGASVLPSGSRAKELGSQPSRHKNPSRHGHDWIITSINGGSRLPPCGCLSWIHLKETLLEALVMTVQM